MNKKGDFDFEWLPGFREMMACQNEEQNTQQETDWGNENLQIEALLPPVTTGRTAILERLRIFYPDAADGRKRGVDCWRCPA